MQCVSDGEARLPAWKLLVFTCRLGYSQVAFVFLRRNGVTRSTEINFIISIQCFPVAYLGGGALGDAPPPLA